MTAVLRPPAMRSTIARRLLVNWRADPDAVAPLLPAGLTPQLLGGHAVVGVCLIRLRHLRPNRLPPALGLASENAAHRVAVVDPDGRPGVYVLRRDTDSRLATLAGGRLFPGPHRRARFVVDERGDRLRVALQSSDGAAVAVSARRARAEVPSVLFSTTSVAERFFADGAVARSPDRRGDGLDRVELRTERFELTPVALEHATSTLWDPVATLDSAHLMTDVLATWLP